MFLVCHMRNLFDANHVFVHITRGSFLTAYFVKENKSTGKFSRSQTHSLNYRKKVRSLSSFGIY